MSSHRYISIFIYIYNINIYIIYINIIYIYLSLSPPILCPCCLPWIAASHLFIWCCTCGRPCPHCGAGRRTFRLRAQACLLTYNSMSLAESHFSDFVSWLETAEWAKAWTATLEQSIHAVEGAGRLHLHAFVEFTKAVEWESTAPVHGRVCCRMCSRVGHAARSGASPRTVATFTPTARRRGMRVWVVLSTPTI